MVHSLVDLAFIARKDWVVQFGAFGYTSAILFAGDISSSERLASRILDIARKSREGYIQWNRFAEVLGARDRRAASAPPARPVGRGVGCIHRRVRDGSVDVAERHGSRFSAMPYDRQRLPESQMRSGST